MKIYKIVLEGRNCWVNLDGTCRRLGFVTIRTGRGSDKNQAVAAAEQKLKEELRSVLLNKLEDVPEFTIGEISEMDEEGSSMIPGAGCTWYPDDPASH